MSVKYIFGNRCSGPKKLSLYVDFYDGDVDLVQKVIFHINGRRQTSHTPVMVNRSDKWRFQPNNAKKLCDSISGRTKVKITVIGRGGTIQRRHFTCRPGVEKESKAIKFHERRPQKSLRPVPLLNREFGIELELSTSSNISTRDVAAVIRTKGGADVVDLMNDYAAARSRDDVWVLMHDGSLACSRHDPDCNKFELKSPILKGKSGLEEVDRVIQALEEIQSSISVNASMGFHVHINVRRISKYALTNVAQNYIKYEQAMDSFMPPSRRTGNTYCKSNKAAVEGMHRELRSSCNSKDDLVDMMCPDDKYFKLNMRPFLETGPSHKPTIEFRQHSATYDKMKIKNWIRFCMAFVHNSAKSKPPVPLKRDPSNNDLFEMMMRRVVRDRYLRDYYRGRRLKFMADDGGECCEGCAFGDGCEAQMK